MNPIDFDKISTWPAEIPSFLRQHSAALRAERNADHNYSLSPSTFRIFNEAPPMPKWDEAINLIRNVMYQHDVIAFHATRLIDFDHIRMGGLKMLDLDRHVELIKEHLQAIDASEELAEVDSAVAEMLAADRQFIHRQGQVWMTPLRRFLYDGGCDVFFESYGGEAIERIAGYAAGKLGDRLKKMGTPAVVVSRFPAFGWCSRTESRHPQGMIELYLEAEGNWDAMDYGWDVMIERHVPPENIVAVVSYDDPSVAD